MTAMREAVVVLLLGALTPCQAVAEDLQTPWEQATWELKALGVGTTDKLQELRAMPLLRRVKLGIVGQGGVSVEFLKEFAEYGHTFTYHDCADPGTNTHDTAMLRGILSKLSALGIPIDVHLWHPGEQPADLAASFTEAGQQCHIVSLYQSFWGPGYRVIADAIRNVPRALFVSPYVEHRGLPTSTTPQGQACRPWETGTISHFITVAPLSRRSGQGALLTPADRNAEDSEAINFIAPSYWANGPGGTCPGAEVAVACAASVWAVIPKEPLPTDVVDILRRTSTIDRDALTSVPEFDEAAVDRLRGCIEALLHPAEGKQRKLDAGGVLNLYAAMKAASEVRD